MCSTIFFSFAFKKSVSASLTLPSSWKLYNVWERCSFSFQFYCHFINASIIFSPMHEVEILVVHVLLCRLNWKKSVRTTIVWFTVAQKFARHYGIDLGYRNYVFRARRVFFFFFSCVNRTTEKNAYYGPVAEIVEVMSLPLEACARHSKYNCYRAKIFTGMPCKFCACVKGVSSKCFASYL